MSVGKTHASRTKDKNQHFFVRYYPEFVSRDPEFVSNFPVAYGRNGRLLLTLLLRALDLAFDVPVILLWGFKESGRSASSRWLPVQ